MSAMIRRLLVVSGLGVGLAAPIAAQTADAPAYASMVECRSSGRY